MGLRQSARRSMCLLRPRLGGMRPHRPCQVAVACLSPTSPTSDLQAGRNRSDWNCTMLHVWRQVGACKGIACCFTVRSRSGASPQLCWHEQCWHRCPGPPAALLFSKRHAGAAVLAWALPAQPPRAVPAATCIANIIDSCRFSRVLHDPAVPPADHLTRAVYTDAKRQQTTLNHFHEKLLHIKVQLIAMQLPLFCTEGCCPAWLQPVPY